MATIDLNELQDPAELDYVNGRRGQLPDDQLIDDITQFRALNVSDQRQDAEPSAPPPTPDSTEQTDTPTWTEFRTHVASLNPDANISEIADAWKERFGEVDPKGLPTYQDFHPKVKEANPDAKDHEIKQYWQHEYGVWGAKEKPDDSSDVVRGFKTAFKQLPQLASGLEAGVGAVGEKVFGEGGIATGIKQHGIEGYRDAETELSKTEKPSDSATYAYEQAKEGNLGALADFLQYGLGYTAAQGVQMLATGGVGYAVGKLGLQGAAKLVAGKMVARETAKLAATEQGAKLTAEQLTKTATANVAGKIGQTVGLASTAVGMEGGEIFGDLTSTADKEGRTLSGGDLAKAMGATLAAGGLEFVGDKIGFDLMVGKSALGKLAGSASGMKGRLLTAGVQAATATPIEAGTEFGQTLIEEAGKGNDPSTPEAFRQAVDSAAMGGFGGAVMGGVGGIIHGGKAQPSTAPPTILKDIHTEAIADAVGFGDKNVSADDAGKIAKAIVDAPVGSASGPTLTPSSTEPNALNQLIERGGSLPDQTQLVQAAERTRQPFDAPILNGPDTTEAPTIQPGQAFTPRAEPEADPRAAIAEERARLVASRDARTRSTQPTETSNDIPIVDRRTSQVTPEVSTEKPPQPPSAIGISSTPPTQPINTVQAAQEGSGSGADQTPPPFEAPKVVTVQDLHALAASKGMDIEKPVFREFTKLVSGGESHLDNLTPDQRVKMQGALARIKATPVEPKPQSVSSQAAVAPLPSTPPLGQEPQPKPETATSLLSRQKTNKPYKPTERYLLLPKGSRDSFEAAWAGSEKGSRPDLRTMREMLHAGNPTLRKEFEKKSGMKLPRKDGEIRKAVDGYFLKDQAQQTVSPKVDDVSFGLAMMEKTPIPDGSITLSTTGKDGTKTASIGGQVVAKADFQVVGDELVVRKIETLPGARKRGIATQLIQGAQAEFPGKKLGWTATTDAGKHLRRKFDPDYGKATMQVVPSPGPQESADRLSTFDAAQGPRSQLPDEQNAELFARAEKAQADLEIAGNERGGRYFNETQGHGSDQEITGLKSATADWYKEATSGVKKLSRERVDKAVAKILADKGRDVGSDVQRIKELLLQDSEFNTSPFAPRTEEDWKTLIAVATHKDEQGEPFSLTAQKETKPKAKGPEQLGIDIPAETIGSRPIIGREATHEEAPLFSKEAQTATPEQTTLPTAAEAKPEPMTILANALRGAADQIEGKPKPKDTAMTGTQDVGEKIGGARKDRWAGRGLTLADLEGMTGGEESKHIVKANIWKPDYAAMIQSGTEPKAAALVKIVYDRLAVKPDQDTPEGRRHYLKMMGFVKEVFGAVKTEREAESAGQSIYRDKLDWGNSGWKDTEKRLTAHSVFKGRHDPMHIGYADKSKADKMIAEGFPDQQPWTRRYMVRHIEPRGMTDEGALYYANRAMAIGDEWGKQFSGPEELAATIKQVGVWDIAEKSTHKIVSYRIDDASAKAEAERLYESKSDDKEKGLEPSRPHLDTLNREGEEYRNGKDVTAEDFRSAFGFRGVEFGNWAASDERQKHINQAYDALRDMADVLGLPPKAMSLNGTLGMAFGARGIGKFAAHYEPSKLVINITKLNGPGSVAHEFGHALDHYFGELDRPDAYKGAAKGASGWYKTSRYTGSSTRLSNLRPEMAQAFDRVMSALFQRNVTKAEAVRDTELNLEKIKQAIEEYEPKGERFKEYVSTLKVRAEAAGRVLTKLTEEDRPEGGYGKADTSFYKAAQTLSGTTGDYWKRPTEMFARSFESYVFDKLGRKSDYLVHGVEGDRYTKAKGYKDNPYPSGVEREQIDSAYDHLFQTMQTKETDKGTALFSRGESKASENTPSTPHVRTLGLPADILTLSSYTSNEAVRDHADYKAAQAGDIEAAVRVVRDRVKPNTILSAKEKFTGAIFVAPLAEESTGSNMLPRALAMHYAAQTGGSMEGKITQTNRARHTGADAMERMIIRPQFDGAIRPGERYVLTDDVTTMGSTLAELADYIQRNGGRVIGTVTLTNASRSGKLTPSVTQQRLLERRFGDAIRDIFGVDVAALTGPEAGYLGNFRDADAIRTRAATAGRKRRRRVSAKGLSEREDPSVDPPIFSRTNEPSSQPSESTEAPTQHIADKISALNAIMEKQEGLDNAFQYSPAGDQGVIDAYEQVFGVDVVPVAATGDGSAGFFGINYKDTLFINTDADNGFVQIAGHELLHQLKKDSPSLYRWFSEQAKTHLKTGSVEHYGKRLLNAGSNLADTDVREELYADFVGDALADPAFLQTLARDNSSKFRMFLHSVTSWLKRIGNKLKNAGFGSSRYFDDIEGLRDYLAAVLNEYKSGKADSIAAVAPPEFARSNDQTKSEAFKKWFMDSKVVDKNGKPLVVYHGSIHSFTQFDSNPDSYANGLIFFTKDPAEATEFADMKGEQDGWADTLAKGIPNPINGQQIYPVYLSIKNPFDPDNPAHVKKIKGFDEFHHEEEPDFLAVEKFAPQIEQAGFDGVLVRESVDTDAAKRHFGAFSPTQVKSAIGNKGTFSKTNPDIRFSRAMEQETGSIEPSVARTRLHAATTSTRPYLLGALTLHQIADVYGKDHKEVARYNEASQNMEADFTEMSNQSDPLVRRWDALKTDVADQMARVMEDARFANFDADQTRNELQPSTVDQKNLTARFEALPKEAQELYREVRDYYKQLSQHRFDAIKQRIERAGGTALSTKSALDNLELAYEKTRSKVYFPFTRFGTHVVKAVKMQGDKEIDRFVDTFDSPLEADRYAMQMKVKGWKVKQMASSQYSRDTDGSASAAVKDILAVIDNLNFEEQPGANLFPKDQLKDAINQTFLNSMPDMSYAKHFMHAKDVKGFSKDALRAFAHSALHGAHHISRIQNADHMSKALTDLDKRIMKTDEGDVTEARQVYNELVQRQESILNPNTHPVAAYLGQLGFVMSLGGVVATGFTNLTQVPLITLPWLGSRFGLVKSSTALAKAYKDFLDPKTLNAHSLFDASKSARISEPERVMLKELQRRGRIDLTQTMDLAGMASQDNLSRISKQVGSTRGKIMRMLGFTFHAPEVMNRQVTALATYRLATEQGASAPEALKKTEQAITDTHFIYSSANRARYMSGNVMRVLTMFKQYPQHVAFTYGRAASIWLSKNDATPEERTIAKKQILTMSAFQFAAAGALGMPFIGTIADVLTAVMNGFGDDDEKKDWEVELRKILNEYAGKEGGEVLAHGLSRLTPWDMAGRLGQNDLFFRAPKREREGRAAAMDWLTSFAGPVLSYAVNGYLGAGDIMKGITKADSGAFLRGTEELVPSVLRHAVKTARYQIEGGLRTRDKYKQLDITPMEKLGQLFGFAPSRAAEFYESSTAIKNTETRVMGRRKELLDELAAARESRNADDRASAMEAIHSFNRRNPNVRITGESIMRSRQARIQHEKNTKNGLFLPKKREAMREKGNFANY